MTESSRLVVVLAVAALAVSVTDTASAEDAPYAEYRYVHAAGQIQITLGFMDRTSDLDARKAALERTGFLILETTSSRVFTRTERVGGHEVITTISLAPPVGHGEGGASSFADVKILLDGKPLVDGPLVRGWGGIDRIAVDPARRYVTVAGHEGIVRYEGFESKRVVDEDWLAEHARTVRELIKK
jgi:hypothetical protein